VILYELLTGRRPFAAEDTAELIREIRESAPKDPRKLRPELHVDLALICLRCLEKSPADRYGSAEALADALRRHANGELPDGASRAQRVWRWYLRHAATTGLISAVVTFLLIMIPTAFSLIHAHGSLKRAQITQANMNSAAMVAGAVLWQLGELEDAVELAAREPLLARAMASGDAAWQQSLCETFFDRSEDPENGLKLTENPPFDSWFLLDAGGGLTAQSGMADDVHIIGMNFEWRDYFAGAWALGLRGRDGAYVSRVIRSENDGFHKFAISTPIYDSERQLVGVLVAAVATSAKLGSLVLDNPQGTTALVAPRDRERGGWPEVSHMILLHPRYGYGEADPLSSAQVEMLDRASQGRLRIEQPLRLPSSSLVTSSDDYRDPAAERHPEFAGRWIAGFAPVGNTGIVVIVQTPHDVLGLEAQFGGQMVMWTCVSAVPSGLLMLFAAWHQRRRRRPGPPGPTALHPLAGSRA
jgi:serine/threonine-protein kinase